MKMRILSATAVLLLSGLFVAQAQADPLPDKVPDTLASRIYYGDTSSYDAKLPLGYMAVIKDGKSERVLTRAKFACSSDEIEKVKVTSSPNSQAFYFVLSQGTGGNLGFFALSANLSSEQMSQVVVDDIATADLPAKCQIDAKAILALARTYPGTAGSTIFYVTGTTLSHLTSEIYNSDSASGGISAGSWLSVGAKYYKSSQQRTSLPIMALRGYAVTIPPASASLKEIAAAAKRSMGAKTPSDIKLKVDSVIK